jgi:glycosyltransferase involved in cell wall biosynthesis
MKVSVITTLFNYKAYIGDCIRSVVTQNYDDLEMIVVDDGSSDDGCSVVESYANKYPRVRLVRLNKNYGYSTAKNVGIKCANGDLICMLDADDMLMPDSIGLRVKKMMKGHDLVHGWAYNFSKRGRSENEMRNKWIKHKNDQLRWKYIHPQGVILKKSIHDKIGLYDEELKCKSDREMWARVFNHNFSIGFLDSPVALYRQHECQMHKSKWKRENNKRLSSELMSLVEIRKVDTSECIRISSYDASGKIMNGKQKISNEEAAPIAASSPQDLYKDDFFAKRVGGKHEYNFSIGNYVAMKLGLSSIIDLGCGIGSFLAGAKAHGVENLCGIEIGYDAAKPHLSAEVADCIKFGNVAEVNSWGKYDGAVSIEVAEHLLPEQADNFCKNLANNSLRMIVMTAAKPGQEGVYHFNCQPKEYWIRKIEALGFKYRSDLSDRIANGLLRNVPKIPKYIPQNIMVFKIESDQENLKKNLIVDHHSEKNISVSFDLPDNDSSGKHKFFQRIREGLRAEGYSIARGGERSSIHFYINNPNKYSKVNIKRLDGVYFDGTSLTRSRNRGILNSMSAADGIIYQSQYCKDLGCKILNFKRSHPNAIIYNGCDPSEFNVSPVSLDKPYFLALCKWRRHKRLKEAVEGFLESGISDHYLVISGSPDYHVSHPLIKYVGDLNRRDLAGYIAGCVGTVHLAWIDWCPNSVVESIMAGKQVIHTNSGGTQEIVRGRGYQVGDIVWRGEQANPKDPPGISLPEIAKAYVNSIKKPIINFDNSDLHIKLSVKKYMDFGMSLLGNKK